MKKYQGMGLFARIAAIANRTALTACAALIAAGTPAAAIAQESARITVSGTVTSAEDSEPLIGATVAPPKGQPVVTDYEGRYTISVDPNATLQFNYVGYGKQSVKVNGRTAINVALSGADNALDEVVVVGYGTVKKSDLTGAVVSLKGEELRNKPSAGIASALQGKVAGLTVTNTSGQPGSTADVKIRGVGSFNSSGPLWVVDGVQQSPGVQLNMNDVESIEVLKDASAAAIYGAAAANGVIIVTTKNAREGETKVNFNAYWGWNRPTNMIKPLKSQQLKSLRIEDFNGQGAMTRAEMLAYPLTDSQKGFALDYDLTNADYDWGDILFGTGFQQNYDVSFSKGTDKYKIYTSFNYYDQKGTYIDTEFSRLTINLNTEVKLFPWLTLGEKARFTTTKNNPYADSRYLNSFLRVLPFLMPYDEANQPGGFGFFPTRDADGNPVDIKGMLGYDGGNPLADELTHHQTNKSYDFNGTAYLKIQPIKQFNVMATFNGGFGSGFTNIEQERYWYHQQKKREYAQMSEQLNLSYGWTANVVATYMQDFGEHSVTAMAGYEAAYGWGRGLNGTARNMTGDLYMLWLASKADRDLGASYSNNATQSVFGRLNYSFKNRYLFTAVVRHDGSDRFAPSNRWGTFPSFSAAWRISEESFLRDATWLNQLKLRASWGKLGNSGIQQFLYTSTYNTYCANYAYGEGPTQNAVTGVILERLPNSKIKWEEITTTDVGIDLALFNNTLTFTADWYIKTTDDALFNTSIPDLSGVGKKHEATPAYIMNVGRIRNTGMDFEINYRNRVGRDFEYNVGGNISYFRNKVLATNENNDMLISGSVLSGTNISYTEVGQPMGMFHGYKVDGVFQNQAQVDAYNAKAQANGFKHYQESGTGPGDLIYHDTNGDGHIDADDITTIGNPWPKFTYGFHLGGSWKFIDFNFAFQGVYGGEIFNEYRMKTHTLYLDYNTTEYALDRWTGEGSTDKNFRMNVNDPNGNESKPSSWFIESASYLRLKEAQIGFSLPRDWARKCGLSSARIYFSGQNLFTVSSYEGFDPEFSTGSNTAPGIDRGVYPQNRTYMCGIQIEL